MSARERAKAIEMLKEKLHRNIYLGSDGSYYVDYSDGKSPRLSQDDVDTLVKLGAIRLKYEGVYELA